MNPITPEEVTRHIQVSLQLAGSDPARAYALLMGSLCVLGSRLGRDVLEDVNNVDADLREDHPNG